MPDDHVADALLQRALPRQLEVLQRSTGLPVVLAGTTRRDATGRHLVLNRFRGTLGDSLHGLSVATGRGLGGTVVARGAPVRVNDYATTAAITHEYDQQVLKERISAIFGVPIKAGGTVYGVLYGAVRDDAPIGDVAVHTAAALAGRIGRDLDAALAGRSASRSAEPQRSRRAAVAMAELAQLCASVPDPELRAQLNKIHRELGGEPVRPVRPERPVLLSPREREVMALVAIGRSNAEIAPLLGLSGETVKTYLRNAMRKLDAPNRTAAVHAARTLGLL